jgi:hypothetical protein
LERCGQDLVSRCCAPVLPTRQRVVSASIARLTSVDPTPPTLADMSTAVYAKQVAKQAQNLSQMKA